MQIFKIIVVLIASVCALACGCWAGLAVARVCIRDHEQRERPCDAPIPGEGWIR